MVPLLIPKSTASALPTPNATGQRSQFLGVLYVEHTSVIDSAFPAAGSWSVVGKAFSCLIKSGPIFWWAMPVPASVPSSPDDAVQYTGIPSLDVVEH
ncbi:hypothetical protein DSO57_1005623 [Entomophthora muscae]|uniref:Uncharacterized protein n=1 Tax=Entomophthora muscae TaxID=34485 RepID=A0ACC2RMQ2_9FUNG|nr:hypothetical protein DSO57_1005623 [Entomophthora muscae]